MWCCAHAGWCAMTDTLVVVTNPRNIPDAMTAFRALSCDVAFVTGYTQAEAVEPMRALMAEQASRYDLFMVCADDCVVTQAAVDAVVRLLEDGHPAATGWCRLDRTHACVNLTTKPLRGNVPTVDGYTWWRYDEVMAWADEVVPTHFMGMGLTAMPVELWQRFPYDVFTDDGRGYSSDFHLSMRLRDAGVPMVAARSGFIDHLKERWLMADAAPHMRLLLGEVPQSVTIETARARGRA